MVMQFFTPRLHCKPIKIMFSLDVGFQYRMSWQRKTLIKVSHFAKALSSLNVDTHRAEPGLWKSTVLLFRPCSSAPRPSVCLNVLQSGEEGLSFLNPLWNPEIHTHERGKRLNSFELSAHSLWVAVQRRFSGEKYFWSLRTCLIILIATRDPSHPYWLVLC